MGRIFDALQRSGLKEDDPASVLSALDAAPVTLKSADGEAIEFDHARPWTVAANPKHRLVALGQEPSPGAEKSRLLAARLRQLQNERLIRKLLITSSVKNEGKTVLAVNLALSLAKTKQRVLLVDGDCHQPGAAMLLDANGSKGLMDWWRSEESIVSYLIRVNELPLWFLPSGGPSEQPLEVLQSRKLSDLINKTSSWFDWVIIDSPPSAPIADSTIWANLADGVLLVARKGKTPRRVLRKVVDSIDPKKLLGIVLNDCSDPDQRYYA